MPLLQIKLPPTQSFTFLHSLSPPKPSLLTFSHHPFFKLPPKPKPISISSCSPPNSLPSTEEQLLDFIAHSDNSNNLPAVRTYENDLGRLTLTGDVSFQQALAAAAADGGETADQHIAAGMPVMVVETVFPGHSDERSTVSTRLFLPTKEVKEKAKKLRNTLPADILSSTTSRNVLAMTFRQVVLQRIWSFELKLFSPGAERNMGDLESPREVEEVSTLSSVDERALSVFAEAVCLYFLESTERDFENTPSTTPNSFFSWFQKPRRIASKDFSVFIYKLSDNEIVQNANNFFVNFNKKESAGFRKMRNQNLPWTTGTYTKLEKIGGPDFIRWATQYLPAYRLEVDAEKLENVKFEGWNNSCKNRWEIHLTHSQMVGLADILDMYYEDLYTQPGKQFSCDVSADLTNMSKSKRDTSLWKVLSTTLASGFFAFFMAFLSQTCWPHLNKTRKPHLERCAIPLSETVSYKHHSLEATELEDLCIALVKKIKDAVGWPGDIATETDFGVWTGELPSYLRRMDNVDSVMDVSSSVETTATKSDGDQPTPVDLYSTESPQSDKSSIAANSAQDIASYQVVLSKDGTIVGFQPTSRLAVNHWASNPLTKELYKGKKLTPGLVEPGLKIQQPDEIIPVELLMSVNPESWFALARPARYLQ